MHPRRLVELKVADNLRYEGSGGRVQVCDFIVPLTRERFLADPRLQYGLFARSITMYNQQLEAGELQQPEGATKAETLAALHIGGRGALENWTKLFERTRTRCRAVREIFLRGATPMDEDQDQQEYDFDAQIEDENVFLGPTEIGVAVERDAGPGSYAEVGPIEIGTHYPTEGASEIGSDFEIGGSICAEFGPSEIGAQEAADREGYEIVGGSSCAEFGPSEIGAAEAADRGGYEIGGPYAEDGASEIGSDFEIGAQEAADREGYEIVGEQQAAVAKVIETARDNRQPPPPMRAVDVDEPTTTTEDWFSDCFLGAAAEAAAQTGVNQFPLMTKLMQRAGAGIPPRVVRIDTADSYREFRTGNSPELAALAERVDQLALKIDRHLADPHAHEALEEDVADLAAVGAAVEENEQSKRVQLWMPKRFDGKVEAWREGEHVCVSIALPAIDGEVRICTSLEPIRRCLAEMSHHASDADVSPSLVADSLFEMGCILGAGTAMKEMAAAAPAILNRHEAKQRGPFVVRIEPKVMPALAALAMMVAMCRAGDSQACDEWQRLGKSSAPAIRQAMQEALQVVKESAGA
jgi:hypothetical protein